MMRQYACPHLPGTLFRGGIFDGKTGKADLPDSGDAEFGQRFPDITADDGKDKKGRWIDLPGGR